MNQIPRLRNIVTPDDKHDDYGFRVFTESRLRLLPDDDWGMELETPDWVQDVHNKFDGRCYLFGTGPSLVEQLPLLERLKDAKTFTCNRAKKWKELPFTPWLHCVTEPGPLERWGAAILPQYDFPEAQNKVCNIWFRITAPGWLWLPKAPDDVQGRWQGTQGMGDRLPPIPTFWASPLTIAQLALWMGFTELVFAGIDTTQVGQTWDPIAGRTQQPRNIRSIVECAERLSRDVRRAGRQIWDTTPGGRINQEGAMTFVDLEELL
jgi:hypothetical protein